MLQEGRFERLGSPRTIAVNVRVVAATNRALSEDVRAGRFRRDLYARLTAFPITMPPLRERLGDIPLLVDHFVTRLAERHQRRIDVVPVSVLDQLCAYEWPGNVGELEHVLEYAVITAADGTLRLSDPLCRPAALRVTGGRRVLRPAGRHHP